MHRSVNQATKTSNTRARPGDTGLFAWFLPDFYRISVDPCSDPENISVRQSAESISPFGPVFYISYLLAHGGVCGGGVHGSGVRGWGTRSPLDQPDQRGPAKPTGGPRLPAAYRAGTRSVPADSLADQPLRSGRARSRWRSNSGTAGSGGLPIMLTSLRVSVATIESAQPADS